MKDKRNRKAEAMYEASKRYQRVSIYGDQGPLVFTYGSTTMELLEAQKHCKYKFRIVSLIYLLPFPLQELADYVGQEAIVVEHNSTGSFAKYLVDNLKISLKKSILRYDGRTWDPIELATMLEGFFHA
jgi:pyruvate/2-oxoacid:ferredoxin oxidoreductase alpha subunit